MANPMSSAVARLTEFFSADHSEAAARRTGCVPRAAHMTGNLLLALVPFGVGSAAKTTLAQGAAQGAQGGAQGQVAPAASPQRRNKGARAFLRARSRTAVEKLPSCQTGGAAHLCAYCTQVPIADSTGCGLPDSRPPAFPGAGGSAAQAGAKMPLVGDDQRGTVDPCALTPGHSPDNT